MKIVTSPVEMQSIAQGLRMQGLRIGLVPTMGWFHEGHLSLMRKAKENSDRVITTLFVNPIQFGPDEDLESYPHDLQRDCKLAESCGVDILYAPDREIMYSHGFSSNVHVSNLTDGLCGASRPGHFDGVTTVLAKLFNQTLPHVAVFGQKDFQQLAVIRRMVQDLDYPIEIVGHPIVREVSGLAMSSRNTYLREEEMDAALSLSKGVAMARELARKEKKSVVIIQSVKELIAKHPECSIDYIEIVNGSSLSNCDIVDAESQILLAVKINDRIRLLDNSQLLGN
ncbi:MAG: pantoate--beta-alanine ligase [Desulfocapsa sp.]|nr:MAG: pantoate--beta-alanine ligase [Desulfocapsa sp.]